MNERTEKDEKRVNEKIEQNKTHNAIYCVAIRNNESIYEHEQTLLKSDRMGEK